MPENISTYWARNVKLKSRQGDKFDFVLNIKNEDGSDYVFAENTEAFFGVYKRTANPEGNLLTDDSGLIVAFDTSVENGKISVFNDDMGGYLASKGTYHYVLFTYDPDNYSLNLQELIADFNDLTNSPINHLRVGWMGEDDSVLPSLGQPLEEWQFYHEYYHLGGADDLEWNTDMAEALDIEGAPGGSIASPLTPPYISYCVIPEWCRIKANLEDGPNVYFPSVSPSYLSLWPYIGQDLIDNDNVWSGDSITYQNGMTEIFIRVDIQVNNVVRCDFEGDPEFTDYYIIEQKGLQSVHKSVASIDLTPFGLPFNVGESTALLPALGNLPKAVNITNTGYDIIYPNEGISWIDENGDEQTGPYWTPPIPLNVTQVNKLFAPPGNSTPSGSYQNSSSQISHTYPPNANGMRELYNVTNTEEYLTLPGYNILSEDDKNAILLNNQNGGWNDNFLNAPNETSGSFSPGYRDPHIYTDIIWDGIIPLNHSDSIFDMADNIPTSRHSIFMDTTYKYINGPLYGWGNAWSLAVQQYDEENGPHAFSTWAILEFLSTLPDPPTDYINFLQSEVNAGARLALGTEYTEAQENRAFAKFRIKANTVNLMSYDSMTIDDTSGKIHLKIWIEDDLGNVLVERTETSGTNTELGYWSLVGPQGGSLGSNRQNGGIQFSMYSIAWGDSWAEIYTNNPNQSWKMFCRLGNLKTCVDPQNIAFETYDGNADLVDFGDDNGLGSYCMPDHNDNYTPDPVISQRLDVNGNPHFVLDYMGVPEFSPNLIHLFKISYPVGEDCSIFNTHPNFSKISTNWIRMAGYVQESNIPFLDDMEYPYPDVEGSFFSIGGCMDDTIGVNPDIDGNCRNGEPPDPDPPYNGLCNRDDIPDNQGMGYLHCNYNLSANIIVGCLPPQAFNGGLDYRACNGVCINDIDNDNVCDEEEVSGCTEPEACNYQESATDNDGSCHFPEPCIYGYLPDGVDPPMNCSGNISGYGNTDLCPPIQGCMDEGAANYNSLALVPCTDPTPNSCCIYFIVDCLDPLANNCHSSCNQCGGINSYLDCVMHSECGGNVCCTYNYGCTNELAENYDEDAVIDDGSCTYIESFQFNGITPVTVNDNSIVEFSLDYTMAGQLTMSDITWQILDNMNLDIIIIYPPVGAFDTPVNLTTSETTIGVQIPDTPIGGAFAIQVEFQITDNNGEIFQGNYIQHIENIIVDNQALLLGDVNMDGEINVLDVLLIINYIMDAEGVALTSEQLMRGDVIKNNVINVNDIVVVVTSIMNDESNGITPQQGNAIIQEIRARLRAADKPSIPIKQTPIKPKNEKQQLIDKILRKQR